MNQIRQEILRKLTHTPTLTFNQLWDKAIPSNKFAYHVEVLVEDNLVEKIDNGYKLTDTGRSLVTYVDGKTGEIVKQPLAVAVIAVIKDNKILLQRRLREPFYNWWGLPAGKVDFNNFISETAQAELFEETGLTGEVKLRGIMNPKTFNNGVQAYNHLLFFFEAKNIKGELITLNREGENRWVSLDEWQTYQIIPDNKYIIESCINENGFTHIELDRFQEKNVFKELKNIVIAKI